MLEAWPERGRACDSVRSSVGAVSCFLISKPQRQIIPKRVEPVVEIIHSATLTVKTTYARDPVFGSHYFIEAV